MSDESRVVLISKEVSKELANPQVMNALISTTFKKLSPVQVRQAIIEGMMRGFVFKDFLEKKIYAVPFASGYSLITSIDYHREIGQKGGVNGKSAPTYVDDAQGKIVSCSVTVYKKDGHEGGYTATVYFSEYYKAGTAQRPSLWDTKPRTMIAKVAEAHALRMACPVELGKLYIEEEIRQEEGERKFGVPEKQGIATAKATHAVTTNKGRKTSEENNEPTITSDDGSDDTGFNEAVITQGAEDEK